MNNTENTNAYGMEIIEYVLKHKIKTMGWYGLMSLLGYIYGGWHAKLGHDVNGELAIIYPSDRDPIEKELAKIAEIKILKERMLK